VSDDTKPPIRKDRRRAKKKTYKLTPRHVEMIRSQKGKQSVREIAKWFARETHYIYKVSPSMVHHILTGKRHAPKEDQRSIYDLIEQGVSEEELATLDPKKVNYD
jgi:DNA-binding PadR family transcriptional regulator